MEKEKKVKNEPLFYFLSLENLSSSGSFMYFSDYSSQLPKKNIEK